MKEITKSHFFWRLTDLKYSLFSKPVKLLYKQCMSIVRFSYVGFILLLFVHLYAGNKSGDGLMYNPLWPVIFLKDIPVNYLYFGFHILLFLAFSLTALYPKKIFLRFFSFAFYFLYVAFLNSFGKINHSLHLPLMLLFCMVFIPNKNQHQYKEKTILMIATAQFFLLLVYSLTGFWKVFWGIAEFFTKEVSLLSPLAMRNIIIRDYQVTPPTIAGNFLLEHYTIGWLLYLLVVYIEFFAVVAFFRPNLHKLWGFMLLSIHFGIYLILDLNMHPVSLLIGLLLFNSPFYLKTSFKTTVQSLPLFGDIYTFLKRISIKNRV